MTTCMNKHKLEIEEGGLRPEYDLRSLRVRKTGIRRKDFGQFRTYLEQEKSVNDKISDIYQFDLYGFKGRKG